MAEEKSCTDFALWGGLTPGLDKLAGLRDAGAIGLKAFMCDSGIASFQNVDAKSLREGMKRAAKLGLPVAVHAEDDAMAAAADGQVEDGGVDRCARAAGLASGRRRAGSDSRGGSSPARWSVRCTSCT